MTTLLERADPITLPPEAPSPARGGAWLWVVQIDCDCGYAATPDWEDEAEPEPLGAALQRAHDLQATGWITRIIPA